MGAITGSDTYGAEIVTERVGSELLGRLRDPTVDWARIAEPYGHLGVGASFPLAVALSAEGGAEIVDAVTSDGRRLSASGDREICPFDPSPICGECPSRRCNSDGSCCDLPCSDGAECPTGYCDPELGICGYPPLLGSPHARGYQAVLTSAARGLFVAGGDDIDTGEPTGQIWFTRLDSDDWLAIPVSFELGRVLSASFSFATGELLVLDERAGSVRLWALPAAGGEARLLGSWPRHPAWDRHWLVIDRDGALLLASARTSARPEAILPKAKAGKTILCHFPAGNLGAAHTISVGHGAAGSHLGHGDTLGPCSGWAIARLDIRDGGAVLDGIASGPEPLWLPPLVDGDGYTLIHHHPDGDGRILRRRVAELQLRAATLQELGWRL